MMSAVADGGLADASALLHKAIALPVAVALTCDQPCRPVCVRGEHGDALLVRAIERACLALPATAVRVRRPPARKGSVAIVGGGLTGIVAAQELATRGYRVTLLEASSRLGGRVGRSDRAECEGRHRRDCHLAGCCAGGGACEGSRRCHPVPRLARRGRRRDCSARRERRYGAGVRGGYLRGTGLSAWVGRRGPRDRCHSDPGPLCRGRWRDPAASGRPSRRWPMDIAWLSRCGATLRASR